MTASSAPLSSCGPSTPASDAGRPASAARSAAAASVDSLLSGLFEGLGAPPPAAKPAVAVAAPVKPDAKPEPFWPDSPRDLAATGLPTATIRGLVLKYLVHAGEASGADAARQVRLPFSVIDPIIRELRDSKLITYTRAAGVSDFLYQPTDLGRATAKHLSEQSTYFGAAPVTLAQYDRAVRSQRLSAGRIGPEAVRRAFGDMTLDPTIERRVGQALASGSTLLVYGSPGNGKTSLAERLVRPFGDAVWVPRSLDVDGDVVRIFDPAVHTEDPCRDGRSFDDRWVRVKRPLVMVGGEMTLESLELSFNPNSRIYEAPVQLKANGGVLLIDDFGRQRVTPQAILNRWIVPLERRVDYLDLANGKRVDVPFEQLLVFSTNLRPEEVADEAFLRRIPYKISVPDPTEDQFRAVFASAAKSLDLSFVPADVDRLIERHYRAVDRPFRFCHPRDLLRQVSHRCDYLGGPRVAHAEALDEAVANYF